MRKIFLPKKQLYHLFEWKDFSIFVENKDDKTLLVCVLAA
jgi:hypothetical protein